MYWLKGFIQKSWVTTRLMLIKLKKRILSNECGTYRSRHEYKNINLRWKRRQQPQRSSTEPVPPSFSDTWVWQRADSDSLWSAFTNHACAIWTALRIERCQCLRSKTQGCGSGSELDQDSIGSVDPDSIGSVDPDPYSESGSGSRRA